VQRQADPRQREPRLRAQLEGLRGSACAKVRRVAHCRSRLPAVDPPQRRLAPVAGGRQRVACWPRLLSTLQTFCAAMATLLTAHCFHHHRRLQQRPPPPPHTHTHTHTSSSPRAPSTPTQALELLQLQASQAQLLADAAATDLALREAAMQCDKLGEAAQRRAAELKEWEVKVQRLTAICRSTADECRWVGMWGGGGGGEMGRQTGRGAGACNSAG
jgi:hypothetical protein